MLTPNHTTNTLESRFTPWQPDFKGQLFHSLSWPSSVGEVSHFQGALTPECIPGRVGMVADPPVYLSSPLSIPHFSSGTHEKKSIKLVMSHPFPWDMWEDYWLIVWVCRLQRPQDGFSWGVHLIFLFSPHPQCSLPEILHHQPRHHPGLGPCAPSMQVVAVVLINLALEMALLIQSGLFWCLWRNKKRVSFITEDSN